MRVTKGDTRSLDSSSDQVSDSCASVKGSLTVLGMQCFVIGKKDGSNGLRKRYLDFACFKVRTLGWMVETLLHLIGTGTLIRTVYCNVGASEITNTENYDARCLV